uniref:Putative GMC oxidoreductase n=1 Tax=Chrysomela populi TaxID=154003 RepID=A0A0U9HSJ2_CHRPP
MSKFSYTINWAGIAFLLCLATVRSQDNDLIDYFTNLIADHQETALNYQLPTDASMYKPLDDSVTDYGNYDFVIVGGGVTGSVLARRLSDMENLKVLLLEAGTFADDAFYRIPSMTAYLAFSEVQWGFRSIPQKTACLGIVNQRCSAYRGKGMGGTSILNGGIYQRGVPEGFNEWAEITNDPSWAWENLIPLFKRSEDFHHNDPNAPADPQYHGTGGPLYVQYVTPQNPITTTFLEANKAVGNKLVDYNGPSQVGATVFQLYLKNGQRQNISSAFLDPVMDRKNLEVLTESYVTKINIDENKKAVGVTFTNHGKTYTVTADKEVILSAGVYQSPQILLLSGIGPKEHLEEVGIEVIEDLEGVGSSLQDDPINQVIVFKSNYSAESATLQHQLEDYFQGEGALTQVLSAQGVAFLQSKYEKKLVDLELISASAGASEFGRRYTDMRSEVYHALWGNTTRGLAINIANVNPVSKGTVRLNSKSPFDYPLIDFNMLSDPEEKDIAVMYEGVKMVMDLMKTPAYQRYGAEFIANPIHECTSHELWSKDYWYCFLRYTSTAAYHTRGSCPMGSDPKKGAVVDHKLRVFGIKNLRVIDSSVLPVTMSGHPTGTCLVIAEKASDDIKADHK